MSDVEQESTNVDIKEKFEAAVARANAMPPAPTDVLLVNYGLFKQATIGDASGERPGVLALRARAKYDAWAGRRGMTREEAMAAYIEAIDALEAGG